LANLYQRAQNLPHEYPLIRRVGAQPLVAVAQSHQGFGASTQFGQTLSVAAHGLGLPVSVL